MAEPPIRIGGSPHHIKLTIKLTAVATVCSGTRASQKEAPPKQGLFIAATELTSAPDFLAHRVAGGVAHTAAFAHRRAPLLDHDLVALARLRGACTDGTTNTGANRRTDWPANREAHTRANSGAGSGITGRIRIGAGDSRQRRERGHGRHRQK
jgi:hypothetical protein